MFVNIVDDVTLADEDTNSYQLTLQIGQSKAMWQCNWRHLVAKFVTNVCLVVQEAPTVGHIYKQYK